MTNKEDVEIMIASLDRVMRLLRRRQSSKHHFGRGVYRLLKIIQEKETISTRELAERLDVRPSSLNEKLSHLEQEEILIRERDPGDQRVFIIKLKKKGEEHLNKIHLERKQFSESIKDILTKEESSKFTELAKKLADGLEEIPQSDSLKDRPARKERHWL